MNQGFDINAPVAAANESSATNDNAMKTGIGLAQSLQDMKAKQAQTAEMQEQLTTHKYNRMMGVANTYSKMSDGTRKAMRGAFEKQFTSAGGDPAVLDLIDSDPTGFSKKLSAASGIADKDPKVREMAVQAMQDVTQFDQAANLAGDMQKHAFEQSIAEARAKQAENLAQIKAGASMYGADQRLEGQKAIGGRVNDRIQIQGNRLYSQEMKPPEDLLLASQKLQHITSDVDAGKLNSNKTIRSEVQAGIAQMLAGGKPSTVFGQQAVEQDSLFQEIKDFSNKYLGEAGGTVPPAQWEQLKKDISALRAANADLHEKKYQAFREGLEGSAVQPHLDSRYNKFRSSMELGGNATGQPAPAPSAEAPAAAPAAADWTSAYKDPVQQKFIQNALSHGYSQGEIEAKLKGK